MIAVPGLAITCDDRDVQAALDRLAQTARTLETPLRGMAAFLCQATSHRFENQIGPDGRRRRLSGLAPGWLAWNADGLKAAISSTTPHAGFVQSGTRHMPARHWLGLSASNRNLILQAFINHLAAAA